MNYIVAALHPWNAKNFDKLSKMVPGNWILAQCKEGLNPTLVHKIGPEYIFFPHWSWKIPKEIYDNYKCIGFHMTDLPNYRGSAPLQGLISLGICETEISAFRITDAIDEGPIYMKEHLSLYGGAEEIYMRCSDRIFRMISYIIKNEPEPVEQMGEPDMVFGKRTPGMSKLPETAESLTRLHDFIRMLDAESYPKAFIEYGDWRIEFSRSCLRYDSVVADVKITEPGKKYE